MVDKPLARLESREVGDQLIDVKPPLTVDSSLLKETFEKALRDETMCVSFANRAEEFVGDAAAVGIDLLFVDDLDDRDTASGKRRVPILWKEFEKRLEIAFRADDIDVLGPGSKIVK